MGFTFDDSSDEATPVAEMRRLIAEDPRDREVIFPYIGGEEVNTSPTQAHHRYVINFGERSEEECRRRWPELMAIVEAKAKPEPMRLKRTHQWQRWCRRSSSTSSAPGRGIHSRARSSGRTSRRRAGT